MSISYKLPLTFKATMGSDLNGMCAPHSVLKNSHDILQNIEYE